MQGGFCAHLEAAGGASHQPAIGCTAGWPAGHREYLWCKWLGFGTCLSGTVSARAWALPDVPHHGGLFREIPGKVGAELPAGTGDALCRDRAGCGTGKRGWTGPRSCAEGRSLYRGDSRHKPAISYEMLFLLWQLMLQIGCTWGLCMPTADATRF